MSELSVDLIKLKRKNYKKRYFASKLCLSLAYCTESHKYFKQQKKNEKSKIN